jgi:hypothetical protein
MKSTTLLVWFCIFILLSVNGCASQSTPSASPPSPTKTLVVPTSTSVPTSIPSPTVLPTQAAINTFFDDFQYASQAEMTSNGWIIRAENGWPGVPGATFRPENVSILEDAQIPNNRLLRMTSSTDGTSANTYQTQICHQRKYLEGTYAARVFFNNEPEAGLDGDQVVETFYMITPYEEPLRPDYSEMDFEYLPNGGWGLDPTTFAFTTWETVRIEPWLADNASNSQNENNEGWRTLVVQVKDGTVRYFVSGKLVAEHNGNYYPDAPMSINFNLWFIDGGLASTNQVRSYQQDIDWIYHEAGVILTPEQVNKKVRAFREAGTRFVDTVPAALPALDSPCDL